MTTLFRSSKSDGTDTTVVRPSNWNDLVTHVEALELPLQFMVQNYGAHGNGTDDDTAHIQAAIDAAEVAGGMVYFPAGSYLITSALTVVGSDITICDGYNSKLVASDGATTIRDGMLHIADTTHPNRLSNIILRDLYFDSSDVASTLAPSPYWNSTVMLSAIDHLTVRNVYVYDGHSAGFTFRSCSDVDVDNCVVDGLHALTSAGGITGGNCFNFVGKYNDDSEYGVPSGSYRITNCLARGTADESWPTTFDANAYTRCNQGNIGFYINVGGRHETDRELFASITNCHAEYCVYGIALEGQSGGGTGDGIVSGNTVRDCDKGIFQVSHLYVNTATIQVNANTVITGNRVEKMWSHGIECVGDRLNISDNVVTDWGMALDTDDSAFGTGAAYAIYVGAGDLDNANSLIARGLVISGNVCRMTSAHNTDYRHDLGGIVVSSLLDHFEYRDIVISGNVVDGGLSTTGGIGAAGIYLNTNLRHVNVVDNIVTGFGGCALYATAVGNDETLAPKDVTIRGNRFYDNCNAGTNYYSGHVTIWAATPDWVIEDKDIYLTNASNSTHRCAVRFCDHANADVAANNVTFRNNRYREFVWGNEIENVVLQTTGTGVRIEGNEPLNYRVAHPAKTGTDACQFPVGTIVWNTAPATGTLADAYCMGWVCTTAGKPGTWSPFGTIAAS